MKIKKSHPKWWSLIVVASVIGGLASLFFIGGLVLLFLGVLFLMIDKITQAKNSQKIAKEAS
jgi:hypothetical protein